MSLLEAFEKLIASLIILSMLVLILFLASPGDHSTGNVWVKIIVIAVGGFGFLVLITGFYSAIAKHARSLLNIQMTDVAAFNLVRDKYIKIIIMCFIMLATGFVHHFFTGETDGLLVMTAGSGILLIHHGVTSYRVKKGYFASNASEAIELIEYIRDVADKNGSPPGVRALPDEDELLSEIIEELAAVGVPAR